jgi:hypothetical protein
MRSYSVPSVAVPETCWKHLHTRELGEVAADDDLSGDPLRSRNSAVDPPRSGLQRREIECDLTFADDPKRVRTGCNSLPIRYEALSP